MLRSFLFQVGFALLALFFVTAFAAEGGSAKPNPKWDFDIQWKSLQFAREGLPSKNIKVNWMPRDPKDGIFPVGVARQYRHLHAMLAAGFFAEQKQHRELALSWLESYECENRLACQETFSLLDQVIKVRSLRLSKVERERAESLRLDVAARLKTMPPLPRRNGLCLSGGEQKRWLELVYQLYCPPYLAESLDCDAQSSCPIRDSLTHDLGRWSGQDLMSSSFLENLTQTGVKSCQGSWEVALECNGAKKQTLRFRCERQGAEVRCQ